MNLISVVEIFLSLNNDGNTIGQSVCDPERPSPVRCFEYYCR
jgi:hypothetical protein